LLHIYLVHKYTVAGMAYSVQQPSCAGRSDVRKTIQGSFLCPTVEPRGPFSHL